MKTNRTSKITTAVAIIGAIAAAMPMPQAQNTGRVEMSPAAARSTNVPVSHPNAAQTVRNNTVLHNYAGGYLGDSFQRSQFWLGVPRFRGYRKGRPRGRRPYRSHQR